jgi:hypothetical protein
MHMLAKARLVRADEQAACLLALPPLTADQVQYTSLCVLQRCSMASHTTGMAAVVHRNALPYRHDRFEHGQTLVFLSGSQLSRGAVTGSHIRSTWAAVSSVMFARGLGALLLPYSCQTILL